MIDIIGVFFMWFGLVFSALGVLGIIRLPDVYTRLHASGKVATLGIFGLLTGASFLMPELTPKAIALGLFLLFSAPVASHAIAAAAYQSGVPMKNPHIDALKGKEMARETREFPAVK